MSTGPKALVAHYTWRVSLVGVSLLSIAGKLAQTLWWAPASGGSPVATIGGSMMMDSPPGALPATLLCALIGIAWIVQGLTRAEALRIDANGVTGFTLLGTRHFAWADIDHVRVDWNAIYKQQITIHATVGSATGGWGILSPTAIPVMTGKIDVRLAEILTTMRQHRRDLPIHRSPMLDRLMQLFTWYAKEWPATLS
jgi:hypothetical protein